MNTIIDRTMRRKCRYHNEKAAVCRQCYDLALAEQSVQVGRQNAAAHRRYQRTLRGAA